MRTKIAGPRRLLQMSASHHHQVMMESSLALGRLDLTSAVGVNMTPCISPAASTKEMSGHRPIGTQGPAHLNGCVPLSHQVAGHKYGVDKVGKYSYTPTSLSSTCVCKISKDQLIYMSIISYDSLKLVKMHQFLAKVF